MLSFAVFECCLPFQSALLSVQGFTSPWFPTIIVGVDCSAFAVSIVFLLRRSLLSPLPDLHLHYLSEWLCDSTSSAACGCCVRLRHYLILPPSAASPATADCCGVINAAAYSSIGHRVSGRRAGPFGYRPIQQPGWKLSPNLHNLAVILISLHQDESVIPTQT